MSRNIPNSSLRQLSEINLTPLMDLTFILLITFIITFPLIEQGIPINLPVHKAAPIDSSESRTVSIDREGVLYLDHSSVDAQELTGMLMSLKESTPDIRILVRADEQLPYGQVVSVLKLLREAQISRMALVTQSDE